MKKSIAIIGHVDAGKTNLSASQIKALHKLPDDIKVVDLSEISPEEARKKFEEIYPEAKQKPFEFEITNLRPVVECFIEKPKKPRYNRQSPLP